jgi:REP element-mobilizing transposase RayT
MSARIVKFQAGEYYHVFNRGANRRPIFLSSENYLYLTGKIEKYASFGIRVVAYCLMPNHYHFLLRQTGDYSVSEFMQSVFNAYTKAFNKMYKRTGTLFEGPFKAIEVLKEDHLMHLCRYIHRNPLEAGLVRDMSDWPYSNFAEWTGKRTGNLVDRDFMNEYFPEYSKYEAFVLEYQSIEKQDEELAEVLGI